MLLDPELLEPVPELELPIPLLLGDELLLPDELGDELLLGELLLDVPPLEELLLPDELGDELLGEELLLLGELLLGELLLDAPPLEELLPDLKCASHSEREMEPSLFVSTDENVGVELLELAPPEALGEDDEEEELGEAALGDELLGEDDELLLGEDELLEEAPPEALPEDLLLSVALGLELDEPLLPVLPVLWAAATPARARSAAAVAETTTFTTIDIPPRRLGETNCSLKECNHHARGMDRRHEASVTRAFGGFAFRAGVRGALIAAPAAQFPFLFCYRRSSHAYKPYARPLGQRPARRLVRRTRPVERHEKLFVRT